MLLKNTPIAYKVNDSLKQYMFDRQEILQNYAT